MLDLNDHRWKEFKGGYKIPYDVSIVLKKLEDETNPKIINELFQELWQELHHQGDVGVASYMALPHLIRIAKQNRPTQYDVLGLVSVIETERYLSEPIPKEFEQDYKNEIKEVIEIIKISQNRDWDRTYAVCAVSAIAAVNGHKDLAKVILELDDEDLADKFDKFLAFYDEFNIWLKEVKNK